MNETSVLKDSLYFPLAHIDSAHYIDIYMRYGGYQTIFGPAVASQLMRSNFVIRHGQRLDHYWTRLVLPPTKSRSIVANMACFEPGMFGMRELVRRNPHGLIEGILLAARATGCDRGLIVIEQNEIEIHAVLKRALKEALEEKLWGEKAPWAIDLHLVTLPGTLLYSDDQFFLSALHGKVPGHPHRMDFLNGDPVHIHRAQEFYAFTWIEQHSVEAFLQKGTISSPGTYYVCIGGNIPNPRVFEIPGGTSFLEIINAAGIATHKSAGMFRWGGVFGRWFLPEAITKMNFDLTHEKLKLQPFQYPLLEWFHLDEIEKVKQVSAKFVSKQSCGACMACLYTSRDYSKWNHKQVENFKVLAKCSFFPKAMESIF